MGSGDAISRRRKGPRLQRVDEMQSQLSLSLDTSEAPISDIANAVLSQSELRSDDLELLSDIPRSGSMAAPFSELMVRFPVLLVHQQYPSDSTRGRLVAALNECFQAGRVPRGKPKTQINRLHFASLLGVSNSMLSFLKDILVTYEECLEAIEPINSLPYMEFDANVPTDGELPAGEHARLVISAHPALYKHQFYPEDGNAARIVNLLNQQIVDGCIQRSRGGKLDRSFISDQLGFGRSNIFNYANLVSDYEIAVGGVESVHEAKIPAMRQWLEQSMADRTLKVRDRKLERRQLFAEFGLGDNSLVLIRYPRIAELVEGFDEKIRSTFYWPLETDATLEGIRAVLADDPPLDKDGITISRLALEAQFGLSPGQASRPPFAEIIKIAEDQLRVELASDKLVAMMFGRIFRFEKLVAQGWSVSYATRLRDSFLRVYRSARDKDAAKRYFFAIEQLMTFVSRSDARTCELVKKGLESRQPMDRLERSWTIVTQLYRDSLIVRYAEASSANRVVSDTNSIIRTLANDGVLPKLDLPLIQFSENNPTHLATVVEARPEGGAKRSKPHVDDYLVFAMSMLEKSAKTYEIDIALSDSGEFQAALREELEREDFTAADNPATLILRILDRRLALIEAAAIKVLKDCQQEWEYGQGLLVRGRDPGEEWHAIIDSNRKFEHDRKVLLRKHFPNGEDSREQGIANLLAVVAKRYGHIYPSNAPGGRAEGQFFQKRALEYGGAMTLQSYLTPTSKALGAIITLYLLAGGSNVSVGRTLRFKCIEECEEPNHSTISGVKAKAKGKPIFSTLHDRSNTVQAIRWLQGATKFLHDSYGDSDSFEDPGQLFVYRGRGGKFKLIEEWAYRDEFKRIIATVPELAGLSLTPNMLRPSILLQAALSSNGTTRLSMALAQHSSGVHKDYVDRSPYRFIHDVEIRHYMTQLETVVISGIEDVHAFLGISFEDFEKRIDKVMRTGLGTICADRHGRPGNDGAICTSLDCWNNCPQLLVIANAEDMAILQIWQYSLRAVEDDWLATRPDRWAEVWLPWLTFCDVVEEKMRRGPYAAIWSQATGLADSVKSNPNFRPMRPF